MESSLILPPGVQPGRLQSRPHPDEEHVVVDNRTDLPDSVVQEAARVHFVENASLLGVSSTFQTYANSDGGLLTRRKFQPPRNVFGEIDLARDLAERDDDVRGTIGAMLAIAFGEGMENFHEDEQTQQLFNQIAKHADFDALFKQMYREYLISGSVTTVSLFTRERLEYQTIGSSATVEKSVAAPLIGVLPAERLRIIDNDIFNTGTIVYVPDDEKLRTWLEEFFNSKTTPGRKAEMARQDRLAAAMFVDQIQVDWNDQDLCGVAMFVYKLNPRMVHRTTMPKDGRYPRPLLTANFPLLEAKRLLNIMDYALLQGGSNYIVVAKQGSDLRPALDPEIAQLSEVVRSASQTGVLVGDHRLSFEIITPNLDALLSPEKRQMIGRKLSRLLLRTPESLGDDAEGQKAAVEFLSRVIHADRLDLKRHIEGDVYEETVKRNRSLFTKGAPKLWFPKIILQGSQFFTDLVLKLGDRGAIPRKWQVEAAGFDYEAGLAQREREVKRGDDDILAPAAVPFSSPEMGPQDNNDGRPSGSSSDNGAPGAQQRPSPPGDKPKRKLRSVPGETVRAIWDEQLEETVRVGEITYHILDEYPYDIGRMTATESALVASDKPTEYGEYLYFPVNPDYEVGELRAVRLQPGLSMYVGNRRRDGAVVAKGVCFRGDYEPVDAEEWAMTRGWGPVEFPTVVVGTVEVEEEHAELDNPVTSQPLALTVNVDGRGGKVRKTAIFDESGRIVGSDEEPVDDSG